MSARAINSLPISSAPRTFSRRRLPRWKPSRAGTWSSRRSAGWRRAARTCCAVETRSCCRCVPRMWSWPNTLTPAPKPSRASLTPKCFWANTWTIRSRWGTGRCWPRRILRCAPRSGRRSTFASMPTNVSPSPSLRQPEPRTHKLSASMTKRKAAAVQTAVKKPPGKKPAAQRWASDVIVDLLHRYQLPYAALNPGASYRGLHDSIVNYGRNYPYMMLCQHEETAVQIAHGYAKASGKPMVAIVHNLVGLLHSNMAVYYAYIDRAPIFIVGATGPMDETKRRPRIDWTHTANVQGQAVRDYTKWDYQPTVVDGVPESFARAYSVMMTEPQGPIYMCYDAWLQEAPLTHEVPLPPRSAMSVPTPLAPDPAALESVAEMLLKAKRPVILAEYVGRHAQGFHDLVAFADTVGAAVYDVNSRLNFPGCHPLNMSMDKEVFRDADLVLCLDTRDWEKPTTELMSATRTLSSLVPSTCRWIDIGFGDLELSSWAMDYQRLLHADLRVMADTAVAIPLLTRLCKRKIAASEKLAPQIRKRIAAIGKRHDTLRAKWTVHAQLDRDASPITLPRLASEVWQLIRH